MPGDALLATVTSGSNEMVEFEFDGALLASSGIAEALHAAGADVCVPVSDIATESGENAAGAQHGLSEPTPLDPRAIGTR